jgi:hypothetical protein
MPDAAVQALTDVVRGPASRRDIQKSPEQK